MIKKLKITPQDLLLAGLVLVVFFGLRLVNLTALPIFADEAIYVRWSQVMRNEPTLRFLPLSDGKQPLYMWGLMFLLPFFKDPLLVGRLISVGAGLGSLLGLGYLSWLLFGNKRIVFWASLFYAALPYFVFFDRMALVDSLLLMLGIWFFVLVVALASQRRLDLALLGGMVLGLALLTKSPAFFFAGLVPVTGLVTKLPVKGRKRDYWAWLKLVGLWLVVWGLGLVIYNILRLGPNFALIAQRNQDYVFPISEVLTHLHDPLIPHLGDLRDWLPNLLGPVFYLGLLGLVWGVGEKKTRWTTAFLFLISFLPILAQSLIAKVFTPRYLLFAVWPLILLAAFFFQRVTKKLSPLARVLLVLALLIIPLRYDWLLLTNLEQAPLPRRMRSGYLEEWSSGYGIGEVRDYLNQRLGETEKGLLVGTEGHFGTLPDGLQIYFDHHPRVTVLGVGQPVREVPASLLEARVDNEVFLIVNQSRMLVGADPRLELVDKFPKAVPPEGEQDWLLLYRLVDE